MTRSQREIYYVMEDCLVDIADGKQINETKLRQLPPWRAMLMATVALRANAMTEMAFDRIKDDVARAGQEGTLPNA